MTKRMRRVLVATIPWIVCLTPLATAGDDPTINVFLWFDTEDYLLPADDDATLRISEFLTREGIRCTHKLVGEKARALERRGRTDVLQALKAHEIGYHSDYHSVQPTPALFLSRQGWDDGVAEFDRRERAGLLDVERITGQTPSCYGQPGSSWGPQQFGAMRRWGMPVYLDAGSHVSLDGRPFWYCGVLNFYALEATVRTKLGGPSDLDEAKRQFDRAYGKLVQEGGGVMSIYYHPCEFVHQQFWDGVNFMKGANPPREEWKIPPQKTPQESQVAYETFEGYIRFIRAHPQVRFVTARQGLELYRDAAIGRLFNADDITQLAAAVAESPAVENQLANVGFVRQANFTLSAAESLALLTQFAVATRAVKGPASVHLPQSPFGPTQAPPTHESVEATWSQFQRTVADVNDYVATHGRVPNAVWLGSVPISPESYLRALAESIPALRSGRLPEKVMCRPATLRDASRVKDDQPGLWGWVIFPPKFSAPDMMALAKRQAWTLKPAMPRK